MKSNIVVVAINVTLAFVAVLAIAVMVHTLGAYAHEEEAGPLPLTTYQLAPGADLAEQGDTGDGFVTGTWAAWPDGAIYEGLLWHRWYVDGGFYEQAELCRAEAGVTSCERTPRTWFGMMNREEWEAWAAEFERTHDGAVPRPMVPPLPPPPEVTP